MNQAIKTLCIFCCVALLYVQANAQQTWLAPAIGYNTNHSAVAVLQIGHQWANNIIANVEMRVPMDKEVNHASYFGAKAGYAFNITADASIAPMIGYYFSMKSTDIKSLNSWQYAIAVQAQYKCFFTEVFYVQNSVQVALGLVAVF